MQKPSAMPGLLKFYSLIANAAENAISQLLVQSQDHLILRILEKVVMPLENLQ